MKLLTHVAVSLAASSAICTLISEDIDISVVNTAFILSLTVNYLIDALGHKRGYRTVLTHEVLSSLVLSLGVASALWVTVLNSSQVITVLTTATVIPITHMLTDALTGYVYMRRPRGICKVSLSLRRYDDYLFNMLAMLVSVLVMLIILVLVLI